MLRTSTCGGGRRRLLRLEAESVSRQETVCFSRVARVNNEKRVEGASEAHEGTATSMARSLLDTAPCPHSQHGPCFFSFPSFRAPIEKLRLRPSAAVDSGPRRPRCPSGSPPGSPPPILKVLRTSRSAGFRFPTLPGLCSSRVDGRPLSRCHTLAGPPGRSREAGCMALASITTLSVPSVPCSTSHFILRLCEWMCRCIL